MTTLKCDSDPAGTLWFELLVVNRQVQGIEGFDELRFYGLANVHSISVSVCPEIRVSFGFVTRDAIPPA